MSRIRSQLDSMRAAESQGQQMASSAQRESSAPRPAYPASHPQTQPTQKSAMSPSTAADLEGIQRNLKELAQRVSAMPRNLPPPQTSHASGEGSDRIIHEIRQEVSRGIEQIRSEAASSPTTTNGNLDQDLRRIADGIAALQNSAQLPPRYIEQIEAELQNLNGGLRQISSLQANPPASEIDLSGVSRSIESGYSEIVNKLDMVLSQRGSELPAVHAQSMPDYGDALSNLDLRLENLSNAVGAFLSQSSGSEDQSREIKALGFKLDELVRSLGAGDFSGEPSLNPDTVERIEARLNSLAKSIDDLQHIQRTESAAFDSQALADLSSYQETVAAELSRLAARIDTIGSGSGLAATPQLFADIQAIADRLDGLEEGLGAVADNLDSTNAVGEGHALMTAPDGEALFKGLSSVELQIAHLADHIDKLPMQDNSMANHQGQEILDVLRDLVGRVETIEKIAAHEAEGEFASPDMADQFSERFQSLESQLATISSQLGSVSGEQGVLATSAADLSPITERLDHIEGQIAASREIVVDIATQAATKAVNSLTGFDGLPQEQMGKIDNLLAELQATRSGAHGERENSEVLGEISQAIHAISVRLNEIEFQSEAFATNNEEVHSQRISENHAPINQSLPVVDDVPTMVPEHAEAYAMAGYDPVSDTKGDSASFNQAEMAAAAQANAKAQLEEVPLEPGSGMPDLEALVRDASNRKRGGEANKELSSDEEGISDLMAAARRAARAASDDGDFHKTSPVESVSAMVSDTASETSLSWLRKLLVASLALVLVVGLLFFAIPRFLGGSSTSGSEEVIGELNDGTVQEEGSETELSRQSTREGDTDPAATGRADPVTPRINGETTAEEPIGQSNLLTPEINAPNSAASFEKKDDNEADQAEQSAGLSDELDLSGMPGEIGNNALLSDAARGDNNALFEIARRYTDGDGVDRNLEEAAKWYRKAAESSHGPSLYRLGNFYEKGHGVAADVGEAANWYAKAAASGNALAMHNLAVLNVQGLMGTEPDMETAIGWFEKAANLGVKDSQVNLGILYTRGMGVGADLEQAYKWFAIAAKGGDNDAATKRDTVAKSMRPEQLERARGEAEIWQPQTLDQAANVASVKPEWKDNSSAKTTKNLSKAEIVQQTQFLLGKMGYNAGPADGIFGAKTERAIRSFQQKNGLTVDGRITPDLMKALTEQAV